MTDKFTQITKDFVKEIDATVYQFRHDKTHAKILYLQNEDIHKTFGIGFRTPISDSTGVPHIMEHSVLCGSEKFDLKDPFVELAKGSLNTYLNAMTYPDKTLYPISSENDKDFHNLMEVYLDAVFFPNIYKNDFLLMQEGSRIELTDINEPLEYKGVVYNEMQGAFSSPDELLFRKIKESLFRDTQYRYESGGSPDQIIELTYEEFLDYHRKYYHPSNSYIVLYGKMNIERILKFIDEDYLSRFEHQDINSQILEQAPYEHIIEERFPYSTTQKKGDQLYLSLNFAVGEATDRLFNLSMHILEHILIDTPASPLRKALIKADIAEDVFGIFQTHLKQPIFSIIAKNAKKDKQEEFYDVIYQTLKQVVEEGIDPDLIVGAIQVCEFYLREGETGGYSKGLSYFISIVKALVYEGDPLEELKYEKILQYIKDVSSKGYFESFIQKHFLDNSHGSKVILYPDETLAEQESLAITEKLANIKAGMSVAELEALIEKNNSFKLFQDTPDKEENIAKIPLLSKDELSRSVMFPRYNVIIKDNKEYIISKLKTNKICYLSFYIHLDGIQNDLIPYLGILVGLLGKLDTSNYNYEKLSSITDMYLGNINYSMRGIANIKTPGKNERYFTIKTKALTEYIDKQLEIFFEILTNTQFDDMDRLLEILKELKSSMQMELSRAGHKFAITRLLSHFTALGEFEEQCHGLELYHLIQDVVDNWQEKRKNFIENLKRGYLILGNYDRMQIGIAIDDESEILDKVHSSIMRLPKRELEKSNDYFEKTDVKEAIVYAGNVNYVALGYNLKELGYKYSGGLQLLKSILSMDYLWTNIRVKNGAYGCFCDFKQSGNVYFASYRDPNIQETLVVYRTMIDYIKNLHLTDRELLQYLIGTISSQDFPFTPATESYTAQLYYFADITRDSLQKARNELFDTTNETLQGFSEILKSIIDKNQYCVFANTVSLEKDKDIFDRITEI
ncbi:MAG: peptidase M16 [Candidatus Epulonipiscioides saccharophilum]|nr:MAG: peptidase M16 [Epulopiscium sp. AS2M-Bin001]